MATMDILPERNSTNDNPPNSLGVGRVIPNGQMLFWSCLVGGVGGVMAIAYYYLLQGSLALVWKMGAGHAWLELPTTPWFYPWILVVTTLGGLGVGLVLK